MGLNGKLGYGAQGYPLLHHCYDRGIIRGRNIKLRHYAVPFYLLCHGHLIRPEHRHHKWVLFKFLHREHRHAVSRKIQRKYGHLRILYKRDPLEPRQFHLPAYAKVNAVLH